jgi:hypothetical protein
MGIMEFQVCRQGHEACWIVTLGDSVYGAYLDKKALSMPSMPPHARAGRMRSRGAGLDP